MKHFRIFTIILLAGCLLASGCTKKPTTGSLLDTPGGDSGSSASAAPSGADPATSGSTSAGSGLSGSSMSEEPVADDGSMTGSSASGIDSAAGSDATITGFTPVYFDFDQYTLTLSSRESLSNNASFLRANPGMNVTIEGHCDERGSDQYNIALGERRAQAAQNYLISLGVERSRVNVVSYGEEMPANPGHDESAWAENRRCEFTSR
ncbi:MAG: peptidoglycan-associated lipoprotein [Desulfuromonas sp.]|nr:MAG: peptidoglycan-associated lipoprotein [Desulfuromonas sp.]